jgi:hypothetical protein
MNSFETKLILAQQYYMGAIILALNLSLAGNLFVTLGSVNYGIFLWLMSATMLIIALWIKSKMHKLRTIINTKEKFDLFFLRSTVKLFRQFKRANRRTKKRGHKK